MSLAEIAYSGWSFVSLTLLKKVAEGPQLFVVSRVVAVAVVVVVVAVAGLVEERRVYLGQQHSENKVVVVAAIVKDSTI